MKIELCGGYVIAVSARGYTLKKEYQGRSKAGEVVTREKKIGYFSDLRSALQAFLRAAQIAENTELHTYFADYANRVEKCNRKTIDEIERMLT